MKTELSFLLDNELEADRQPVVLKALHGDAELRAAWDNYLLIGDVLRRSPNLNANLTRRVMDDLRHEPAILVPNARPPHPARAAGSALRYATALAASLAGVAVVGWVALSPPAAPPTGVPQRLALNSAQAVQSVQPVKPVNLANANRMQEFLVAHQGYSPSNHFDGGASYIRTVSASR